MATKLARVMVTEYGMSEKLGPLTYAENEQEIFLGHSVTQTKHVSEATAKLIDAEVRRLVDESYARARKIIEENIDGLHTLAKALIEYETLTGEDIAALLKGEEIVRPTEPEEPAEGSGQPTSVPTSGGKGVSGDLEPEPQTGS